MKNNKHKLVAKWEVLTMAKYVEENYKDSAVSRSDRDFFDKFYQGNWINLMLDNRVDPYQIWNIKIETKAKDDNGVIHTHELEWQFDKPMTMTQILKGDENIKFNEGGFKKRWQGVTKQWLDCVDSDLEGMDCIEAWVTSVCYAKVKNKSVWNILNNSKLGLA